MPNLTPLFPWFFYGLLVFFSVLSISLWLSNRRLNQRVQELDSLCTRARQDLERRVQELDSILRTTNEGLMLLDLEGRVVGANYALAHYLNAAGDDFEGVSLASTLREQTQPLIRRIGYDQNSFRSDCQVLASGDQEIVKRSLLLAGPPQRHIERGLAAVRDAGVEITGWLLIFRDTSEEIQLARLRDEMMHMLIHDLRSPLATLASSLSMLEDTVKGGSQENFSDLLELSHRGTERMLGLVNELLEINKLESGEAPLKCQPVSIKNLLEEIASQFAPLAMDADILVMVDADESLPKLYVDPQQIGRVISNLLDNAIKFTPNGGQVRLWSALDPQDSHTHLLVGVSDTGPGIPAEASSRIFEKFQRVTSIKGRRLGTGLGLSFCKLAVEKHGGKIWVESQEGQGSTFTMTLPL